MRINPDQFTKVQEINLGAANPYRLDGINLYTNLSKMLKKEEFDMVDICLPSYLHKEYTLKLFRAGKHVFCEKPMALSSKDCKIMIDASNKYGKKLMIGQCLRFEPQYLYLKECIENGTFGKVKNMFMNRLSVLPRWGFENWFFDTEKSGGCIMDLHIHDVDMVRFLFGEPESVSAIAYDDVTKWQVVNSRFYYPGMMVVANGSWDEAGTVKFKAEYRARFENASVILENNRVTVYPDKDTPFEAPLKKADRMAEEIRALAMSIADENYINTSNPPESAMSSVKLVEQLKKSADAGGKIIKNI